MIDDKVTVQEVIDALTVGNLLWRKRVQAEFNERLKAQNSEKESDAMQIPYIKEMVDIAMQRIRELKVEKSALIEEVRELAKDYNILEDFNKTLAKYEEKP